MGRIYCAVAGCSSARDGASQLSFYRIHCVDREVNAWVTFCRNSSITKNSVICSNHFKDSDFHNPNNKSQGLYLHARPSLYPGIAEGEPEEEPVNRDAESVLSRTRPSLYPGIAEGEPEEEPVNRDAESVLIADSTEEPVPMEIDENYYYNDDDIEMAGEVEVGAMPEVNVTIVNKNIRKNPPKAPEIDHDHDYCGDVDHIVACMERLVVVEEENKELKKNLRSKQKQASKLKARVRSLTAEVAKLKKTLSSQSEKIGDPILAELQKNKSRKPRGQRYSNRMRNMAIILHYCSSKAYRQMRKYFTLPSVETIKRWLSKLDIKEGYSTTILKLLKLKVAGFPEDEKLVTIFIDEMSVAQRLTYVANGQPDYFTGFPTKVDDKNVNINERASSALTIMVKSIKSGYKQAIGYFFNPSSVRTDRLRAIVEGSLKVVRDTGLIPKLIVCDQNSTNRALFAQLGVNSDRPWFMHRDLRIFCAFDAPHLLKSARNNLLKHNAVFEGKICSFQHVIDLFTLDFKTFPRIVPKLSPDHINLAPFAEMNVSLAAETLSESVSKGFDTYVKEFGKLSAEHLNTAKYIEQFDKLFDCANSSTFNEAKDLKRPLQDKSPHWTFLKEMKNKLKTLRFISEHCFNLNQEEEFPTLPSQSRKPYFISGWLLYISAIEGLWAELHSKHGFSFLRTRNLSQDCLEHFFSLIRWKNCNNNHPDPRQFTSAYKSIVVNQLIAPKKLGNVQADLDKYFVNMPEMAKVQVVKPVANLACKTRTKNSFKETDTKMNIIQSNSVYYTAGWVASKLQHEECISRSYIDVSSVPEDCTALLNNKKFKPTSNLRKPGFKIFKLCKKLVSIFENNFENLLKKSVLGVKKKLLSILFWPYKSKGDETLLVYDALCIPCAEIVANKYVNMLIKAKLQVLNAKFKARRQQKRKSKNGKAEAKRRKLNIHS